MSWSMTFALIAVLGSAGLLLWRLRHAHPGTSGTPAAAFGSLNLSLIVLLLQIMPAGSVRALLISLLLLAGVSFLVLEYRLGRRSR